MKHLYTLVLLTLTLTSFSQEWVRQHPFLGFAPLHAITFDESGNGWTVGGNSVVLHTTNWGALWVAQKGITGLELEAVEIVPGSNSQIVLVGGPGVFITYDAGETWEEFLPIDSIENVTRIQAFDDQNWIVIGRSEVMRTMNAGYTWESFAMPDNSANAAWFNDLNNGWAGAGPFDAYQLYKTTNGGQDWVLADDDIYPIITDIQMIDNQTGFLSGRDYMFKTTNGGADWERLHDDVQPTLTGMHVVNENIIYSGLLNGFVFYTLNGGSDWTQTNANLINSNQIDDVFATIDGRVWTPGKYGSVTYSDDFGQTWIDQTPGTKNTLLDIKVFGDFGFAVGSDGAILRTTNAGAIWEDISSDPLISYSAVTMALGGGKRHIFLGASNGTVLRSVNDGETFETLGNVPGGVQSILALNPQRLFLGADNGIHRSVDSGHTWLPVAPTTLQVEEIAFPNIQTGFAAVTDGQILKSTNEGLNWNPVLLRSGYEFTGIHFRTALHGWAVAELKDSVWSTVNGGMSWTAHKLPVNTFWQDIHFMDADTGYISGGGAGDGRILRTTDGGLTWKQVYRESDRLNRMHVRAGEDFVWVVGFGGNIVHYSPCALAPEISNLTGDENPCEGDITAYEVNSSGATVFTWTVPAGWTILGNDNSARVEVLVGPGPGVITILGANSCGTETTTLTLIVEPGAVDDVTISDANGTLSTLLTNVTYQWLQDGIEIPGAIDPTFTPVSTGNYSLLVTFPNGCTSTSNEILVTISGLWNVDSKALSIYPNPASDLIYFQNDFEGKILRVDMFDSQGRRIGQNENEYSSIDVRGLLDGLYSIEVVTTDGRYIGRFIKG